MIDLFCGLGGGTEGAMAEGYDCVGFDIERHRYPAREIAESHIKGEFGIELGAKGMGNENSRSRSLNTANEARLRESPLIGGWQEYPAQLVLQDALTIHGKQFKSAAYIWASPPCTEYSYMAMPWSRGKQISKALRGSGQFPEGYTGSRTIADLNALFDACFRIQREACEAAGRYIPMVVENVKGAQPWVGRARANFGSFYLWGDVGMVGRRVVAGRLGFGSTVRSMKARKVDGFNFHQFENTGEPEGSFQGAAVAQKVPEYSDPRRNGGPGKHLTSPQENADGIQKQPIWFNDDKRRAEKCGGDWSGSGKDCSLMRSMGSKSSARKAASAQIAKIPFALSRYIAHAFNPAP